MLCEGPASKEVFSKDFISQRKTFLEAGDSYDDFVGQFAMLSTEEFSEIVLWFEYDLFCHVNLSAAVYHLDSLGLSTPISLVCSGVVEGSERLLGLSELSETQLLSHFTKRARLSENSIATLIRVWEVYCSDDHSEFMTLQATGQLPYLEDCIAHHLQRFPQETNGLSILEQKMLARLDESYCRNTDQWVGSILRDQGFYGFGDLQYFKFAERLNLFVEASSPIGITALGKEVLANKRNIFEDIKDDTRFGGALKYGHLYNAQREEITRL